MFPDNVIPGDYIKTEFLLFILAALAIVAMAAVMAIAVLYPGGVLQGQSVKYLTVTASGTSYSYPQTGTIYVSMNGTGGTAEAATSNLSATLDQFNYTVLKFIGGNSSRIQTEGYSLQRVWNSSKYVATETVAVSVPDVQNVSSILGTLSLIQNIYISQVTSQLSDRQVQQLTQSALQLALQNATVQAQALAGNSTVTLVNVTVSKTYTYPFFSSALAASSAYGNPIFFNGRQAVEEQVTALFSYG